MSSRYLHPLACRLPRAKRDAVVATAIARGVSVSGLIKEALRHYLGGVDPGVHARYNHPAPNTGPNATVTPQHSPRSRGLAEAFAAGQPASPTGRNPNASGRWVDMDIGLPGASLNQRLKPRPRPEPPSGKKFVDTF
jgi:hypothetical protein